VTRSASGPPGLGGELEQAADAGRLDPIHVDVGRVFDLRNSLCTQTWQDPGSAPGPQAQAHQAMRGTWLESLDHICGSTSSQSRLASRADR
jgi:uncharacterized lipoprotein YddW (UPF0748 family)